MYLNLIIGYKLKWYRWRWNHWNCKMDFQWKFYTFYSKIIDFKDKILSYLISFWLKTFMKFLLLKVIWWAPQFEIFIFYKWDYCSLSTSHNAVIIWAAPFDFSKFSEISSSNKFLQQFMIFTILRALKSPFSILLPIFNTKMD